MRLAGKSAIVTGGASGIGAASVEAFVRAGEAVTIADISDAGEALAARLRGEGGAVRHVRADMAKTGDVAALFDAHMGAFGALDILFNNASTVGVTKPIADTTEEEMDQFLAVNFKSVFLACKQAAPIMTAAGRGSIINTSSASSREGLAWAHLGGYTASKGAVVAFTRVLAVELSPMGVRVNSLSPGVVDTPMTRAAAGRNPDPAATIAHMSGIQLLHRMARPDELARAALFLASDDSSYVTGIDMLVDGGLVLGGG